MPVVTPVPSAAGWRKVSFAPSLPADQTQPPGMDLPKGHSKNKGINWSRLNFSTGQSHLPEMDIHKGHSKNTFSASARNGPTQGPQ